MNSGCSAATAGLIGCDAEVEADGDVPEVGPVDCTPGATQAGLRPVAVEDEATARGELVPGGVGQTGGVSRDQPGRRCAHPGGDVADSKGHLCRGTDPHCRRKIDRAAPQRHGSHLSTGEESHGPSHEPPRPRVASKPDTCPNRPLVWSRVSPAGRMGAWVGDHHWCAMRIPAWPLRAKTSSAVEAPWKPTTGRNPQRVAGRRDARSASDENSALRPGGTVSSSMSPSRPVSTAEEKSGTTSMSIQSSSEASGLAGVSDSSGAGSGSSVGVSSPGADSSDGVSSAWLRRGRQSAIGWPTPGQERWSVERTKQ